MSASGPPEVPASTAGETLVSVKSLLAASENKGSEVELFPPSVYESPPEPPFNKE